MGDSISTLTPLILGLFCPSWMPAKKLSWQKDCLPPQMLASVWATWLMFGDIPIRQLGLWVGPCICSDKNTLLISVSQLWYLCLFSFNYVLSCSVMSDSVTTWTIVCFSVHGDSPGKNTRVGCHALLQGIFPTQGLNPRLPHCWELNHWLKMGNFIKYIYNFNAVFMKIIIYICFFTPT